MESSPQKWKHPGGKPGEFGPKSLTDTALLAILISEVLKKDKQKRLLKKFLQTLAH